MYGFKSYKKGYLKGIDGKYKKVSEEMYNAYMRPFWREEKASQRERKPLTDKKKDRTENDRADLPKVVSYDSLAESQVKGLLPNYASAEEEVVRACIRAELHDRLYRALEELGPEEKFLIGKLYLEGDGMSIREFSVRYGVPRTTVQYQRIKLMKKLRAILESEDGFSPDTVHAAFEHNGG